MIYQTPTYLRMKSRLFAPTGTDAIAPLLLACRYVAKKPGSNERRQGRATGGALKDQDTGSRHGWDGMGPAHEALLCAVYNERVGKGWCVIHIRGNTRFRPDAAVLRPWAQKHKTPIHRNAAQGR